MNRWAKNGVLDKVFEHLLREQIVRVKLEAVSMESTIVKVHPDGTGASKKTDLSPLESRGADGLAALVSWSGLRSDDFVRSDAHQGEPEPLAMISTYLRSDKNLTPEAAAALDQVVKVTYERLRNME